MKKCILYFLLIIVLLSAAGCSIDTESDQGKIVIYRDTWNASDVTSPDGVHYWLYSNGRGGQLVPRFGMDGKIMVDEQ